MLLFWGGGGGVWLVRFFLYGNILVLLRTFSCIQTISGLCFTFQSCVEIHVKDWFGRFSGGYIFSFFLHYVVGNLSWDLYQSLYMNRCEVLGFVLTLFYGQSSFCYFMCYIVHVYIWAFRFPNDWSLLTLKVLVTTIDAQWEGMGDVGSARYEPALLPPCPTIRLLSYSNS